MLINIFEFCSIESDNDEAELIRKSSFVERLGAFR
jgi:hypothetical protein